MPPPWLILQLSDIHVTVPGGRSMGNIDANARAERTAAWLANLAPAPDLVLITGDNVNVGSAEEYAEFVRIFGSVKLPVRVLPGNHDDRDGMRKALVPLGWCPADGPFLHDAGRLGGLTILTLDTLCPGDMTGELCAQRLDWLTERLAETGGAPVLLALHHPPFDTGIDFMDKTALRGRDALARLVAEHGNVVGVIAGHLHRPVTASWAGTVGIVAPSAGRQLALDFKENAPAVWSEEPPAAVLHRWSPEGGLVSHVVAISA